MATKYTEKEYQALNDKERNPEANVICPRCGEPLNYRAAGNSYEIKCPTENCLKRTVRGL